MSPGSRKFGRFFCSLLAQTPAKAVGLQFDLHLQRVGFALLPAAAAARVTFGRMPEQVLHVMADLMRDHIGCGELARTCPMQPWKRFSTSRKKRVEIDLLVARTIERSHRGLRHAAAPALVALREQHELRPAVGLAARAELLAPDDRRSLPRMPDDHAAHLVARRAGLALPGRAIGLIGRDWLPPVRISAPPIRMRGSMPKRIADEAENDDGADAESATAHRQAKAAAATAYRRRRRRDGLRCCRCGGNHRSACAVSSVISAALHLEASLNRRH